MKPNAERAPALAFIFVTLVIDIMGFGLIIPVQPRLVQQLGHLSITDSAPIQGWLQASFGLMQFVFAPVLGNLSDRYGRRPVLLLSLAITAAEYLMMALTPNLAWLFVGRILSGITSASFTAASAYIADVSPPEKRAQNFGMIGAAFGVGFIVGPALGAILGSFGLRMPFWIAAALTIGNFLYGFWVLPESLAPENRRAFDIRRANPFGTLKSFSHKPWVLMLAGSLTLLYLAQQCLHNTWALSNQYRYRWSVSDIGYTLALLGAASIAVQMGLLRVMLPKLGEARTLLFGLVFQIVGFVGFGFAPTGAIMVASLLLWSLSFVGGPATQGIVSKGFGPDEQGAVQGGLTSLQSITGVFAPLISTGIFAHYTSDAVSHKIPGAPFIFGAALSVLSLILAFVALSNRRRDHVPAT